MYGVGRLGIRIAAAVVPLALGHTDSNVKRLESHFRQHFDSHDPFYCGLEPSAVTELYSHSRNLGSPDFGTFRALFAFAYNDKTLFWL